MLRTPESDTISDLVMYRFHFGSLTVQDWEDQWSHVTCYPHFSLMPYTDESHDNEIDYAGSLKGTKKWNNLYTRHSHRSRRPGLEWSIYLPT
jgi:hypothetical protein